MIRNRVEETVFLGAAEVMRLSSREHADREIKTEPYVGRYERTKRGERFPLSALGGGRGPGCTAVELGMLPSETRQLLPLLPLREERAGERRAVQTPLNSPLPNPLPVRLAAPARGRSGRGEGEAASRPLASLNSTAVGPG